MPLGGFSALLLMLNHSSLSCLLCKQALCDLLQMKDAEGHLIISQKNQWAGIMSVLVHEYHVIDAPDMRAFCCKMDEWGFGKGSGYDSFCDYENVAGASDYAQFPFKDWSNKKGIAYRRQVRAATELRGILKGRIEGRL